jgi:hypothetical protein
MSRLILHVSILVLLTPAVGELPAADARPLSYGAASLPGALLLAEPPVEGRRMPVPPRMQWRAWSATASGPAALGTVMRTYGRRVSAEQLEQAASAVGKKATLAGLETAARTFQFRARVTEVAVTQLARQPLPAILLWNDGEFRVLLDVMGGEAETYDPVSGRRERLSPQQMSAGWSGSLLLVHPRRVQ